MIVYVSVNVCYYTDEQMYVFILVTTLQLGMHMRSTLRKFNYARNHSGRRSNSAYYHRLRNRSLNYL